MRTRPTTGATWRDRRIAVILVGTLALAACAPGGGSISGGQPESTDDVAGTDGGWAAPRPTTTTADPTPSTTPVIAGDTAIPPSAPPSGGRDAFTWPFSADSPWNTPLGSGARFAASGLTVPTYMGSDRSWIVRSAAHGPRARRRHQLDELRREPVRGHPGLRDPGTDPRRPLHSRRDTVAVPHTQQRSHRDRSRWSFHDELQCRGALPARRQRPPAGGARLRDRADRLPPLCHPRAGVDHRSGSPWPGDLRRSRWIVAVGNGRPSSPR